MIYIMWCFGLGDKVGGKYIFVIKIYEVGDLDLDIVYFIDCDMVILGVG